jgi:uncharacterized protein with ParB-like and HNH nuclease domain
MLRTNNGAVPVRTLREYFTQDRLLRIPEWQREYSWQATESGQVGVLLSDLKEFVESSEKEYLLGSIILCDREDNSQQKALIDGQQRTLTLLLFLFCARKYIRNQKLADSNVDAHPQLIVDIRSCISADPNEYRPRVLMNQENANKIIESLYHWSGATDGVNDEIFFETDSQSLTQSNLVSVARYIYSEHFLKNAWIPKTEFLAAIDKILNNIRIVELALTTQSEAIAVFDRINDRGLNLTSADLIKNRIFQTVTEDDFTEISRYWQDMSAILNDCHVVRLKDPKFLLRALAWSDSSGKKITYDQLTKFWSDKLKDKSQDPVDLALDLGLNAQNLKNFSDDLKSDRHGALSELYFAYNLKSVQQYPLLLAVSNFEDQKVFKRAIKQIANRTAFYTLSGERTQDFESLVPKWAAALRNLGPNATIVKLDTINAEFAGISEQGFDRLKLTMQELNYQVASDRAKIRAILAHLSWLLDLHLHKPAASTVKEYFEAKKPKGQKNGWDIDHIAPGSKKAKDAKLHSLGNLVLLHPSDNRSAQDALPIAKNSHYQQSHLNLTKSVTTMDTLVEKDRKLILGYFAEADIKECKWDLKSWGTDDISLRFDLYFALLKQDLTSF